MKKEKIMEKENGKTYLYSVVENNANKYFKKELNSVDDEHIQMLNNELHKWNLLKKYPFVANICYFDNDKQHYIMYEYIEGENLSDYKFKDVKEKLEDEGFTDADVERLTDLVYTTPSLGGLIDIAPSGNGRDVVREIYKNSVKPL